MKVRQGQVVLATQNAGRTTERLIGTHLCVTDRQKPLNVFQSVLKNNDSKYVNMYWSSFLPVQIPNWINKAGGRKPNLDYLLKNLCATFKTRSLPVSCSSVIDAKSSLLGFLYSRI